ncbi:MAG: C45 family autoproteolytic acyltransferase/hydrolase [Actinomycetota bacterium]
MRFRGTYREIGAAHGRALGPELRATIDAYLGGLASRGVLDVERLHAGALGWLETLPDFYREEMEGMAEGSGVPLEDITRFNYAELCLNGCSGAVCMVDGKAWVARNNDADPFEGLWGDVVIRDVVDRIPTLAIGLKGDVFIATGINRERLWIHHNYLEAHEGSTADMTALPSWALVRQALETCTSVDQVEELLDRWVRLDGMNLFVVDGKTQEAVVFECSRASHVRRTLSDGNLIATNHYVARGDIDQTQLYLGSSRPRYERILELLQDPVRSTPDDLIAVLADPEVEQNRQGRATVYSAVACPATGRLWWACGAIPSASRGSWNVIEWPWEVPQQAREASA